MRRARESEGEGTGRSSSCELRSAFGGVMGARSSNSDRKLHHAQVNDEVEGGMEHEARGWRKESRSGAAQVMN